MSRAAVSITKCPDYDLDRVRASLRETLDGLPGMDDLVSAGDLVVLKPNLLSSHHGPDAAINTHPAVVRATAEWFRERDCRVVIGDSCGSVAPGATRRAFELTQLVPVAEATGAEFHDFDRGPHVVLEIPNGKVLDRLRVPKIVRDADLLVTLPKLKTHSLTMFTGAVKNQFGLVPGRGKKDIHIRAPKPRMLAQALVDIHSVAAPNLAIMDGIVGMEGRGPSAGRPRPIGVLLAGTDCVAVDAVAADIIGFAPGDVDSTALADASGLGVGTLDRIEVRGAALSEVHVPDFAKPPQGITGAFFAVVPSGLIRWGINVLGTERPDILEERCTVCGECAANCPAGALRRDSGRIVLDQAKCIGCHCCAEVCKEHAIEMRRPFLGRILRRAYRFAARTPRE